MKAFAALLSACFAFGPTAFAFSSPETAVKICNLIAAKKAEFKVTCGGDKDGTMVFTTEGVGKKPSTEGQVWMALAGDAAISAGKIYRVRFKGEKAFNECRPQQSGTHILCEAVGGPAAEPAPPSPPSK